MPEIDPAAPAFAAAASGDFQYRQYGLTVRAHFASDAVKFADALIAELNKETTP